MEELEQVFRQIRQQASPEKSSDWKPPARPHQTYVFQWQCLDVGNQTAKIEYFPSGSLAKHPITERVRVS